MNGKRKGFGCQTWFDDGNEYRGIWKDNLRHGLGTFIYKKEGLCYQGTFENNKKQGHGRLQMDDRRVFVGEFFDVKKNGVGILTNKDGTRDLDVFKDDKHVKTITKDIDYFLKNDWEVSPRENKP